MHRGKCELELSRKSGSCILTLLIPIVIILCFHSVDFLALFAALVHKQANNYSDDEVMEKNTSVASAC